MQNTTTNKEIPDKLIENFLISGLSQDQLIKRFQSSSMQEQMFSFFDDPKILFSMKTDTLQQEQWIQFIYPEKIQLKKYYEEPTFNSFLGVDGDLNQSYFHVLTFYENLNRHLILHDFNYQGAQAEMIKLRNLKIQKIQEKQKKSIKKNNMDKMNLQEKNNQILNQQRLKRMMQIIPGKKIKEEKQNNKKSKNITHAMNECNMKRMKDADLSNDWINDFGNKKANMKNNIMATIEIKNHSKESETQFIHLMTDNEIEDSKSREQTIIRKSYFQTQQFKSFSKIKNQLKHVINIKKLQNDINSENSIIVPQNSNQDKESVFQSEIPQQNYFELNNIDSTPNFGFFNQNLNLDQHSKNLLNNFDHQRYQSQFQLIQEQKFDVYKNRNTIFIQKSTVSAAEFEKDSTSNEEQLDSEIQKIQSSIQDDIFVPVSFIIQTKVEFHDHFKLILMEMFQSLKNPKNIPKKIKIQCQKARNMEESKKNLARTFSQIELINNIAFLCSIPAPVFNSEARVIFMNQVLRFKENKFNELPNKNLDCIKVMIECLDFQTIITCIKALIFDRNLIIFSDKLNLLFCIVEGFKQLMFPFTVDNPQFVYANNTYQTMDGESLQTIAESCMDVKPILLAIQTKSQMLDIEKYKTFEETVILDIEASVAIVSDRKDPNREPIPKFPQELNLLKTLNMIRNKKLPYYDKAKYESIKMSEYDEKYHIAKTVREVMFSKFIPFLREAFQNIEPINDNPQNGYQFFDKDEYLENLKDNCPSEDLKNNEYFIFGKSLVESVSFVRFMDGYIDKEILNFDLVNSILCYRRELNNRYKKQKVTFSQFDDYLINKIKNIPESEKQQFEQIMKQESEKSQEFTDNPVSFMYKIPSMKQRLMLFEKISYIIDKNNRENNSELQMNATQKDLINKIIEIYRAMMNDGQKDEEQTKSNEQSDNIQQSEIFLLDNQLGRSGTAHFNQPVNQSVNFKTDNIENKLVTITEEKSENGDFESKRYSETIQIEQVDKGNDQQIKFVSIKNIADSMSNLLSPQMIIDNENNNLLFPESSQKKPFNFFVPPSQTDQPTIKKGFLLNRQKTQNIDKNRVSKLIQNKLPNQKKGPHQELCKDISQSEYNETQNEMPQMQKKESSKQINEIGLKKIYEHDVISIFDENPIQQEIIDVLRMQDDFGDDSHHEFIDILNQICEIVEQAKMKTIIYGQLGLLEFLANLFVHFSNEDREKINFYFTIREKIDEFISRKQALMVIDNQLKKNSDSLIQQENELSKNEILQKEKLLIPQEQLYKPGYLSRIISQHQEKNYRKFKKIQQNILNESQIELPTSNQNLISDAASVYSDISISERIKIDFDNDADQDLWFWIEKGNELITYQEILTFIKFVTQFENKDKSNQIILLLIFNFPVNPQSYYLKAKYLLNNQRDPDIEKITCEKIIGKDWYSKCGILEFLFPLSKFLLILENLNRQQIFDLYTKIKKFCQNTSPVLSEDFNLFYNQHINQFDKCNIWSPPVLENREQNILRFSESQIDLDHQWNYETITNFAMFIVQLKFDQTVYLHQQDMKKSMQMISFITQLETKNDCDQFYALSSKKALEFKGRELSDCFIETIDEQDFFHSQISYILQQKREKEFKKSVTYQDDYLMVDINTTIDLSLSKKKSRNSSTDVPSARDSGGKNQHKCCEKKQNKQSSFLGKFKGIFKQNDKSLKNKSLNYQIYDEYKLTISRSEQTPRIIKDHMDLRDESFIRQREQIFEQLQNQAQIQNKRENFKQLKNPIQKSKDLLKQVVNYWLQGNNLNLLNSKIWSHYVNDETQYYRQQFLEANVYHSIIDFQKLEPDFTFKEGSFAQNLQLSEYKEYAKQCFYINIYNSLILYKLAEMSCTNPKSIFKLKNYSSWLALEQNSRITIASNTFTAYQIKLQIVKNQSNMKSSNYSVNQEDIHKLIDFAFFMPRNGMMNLKNLIFKDVSDLIMRFPIDVKAHLGNKIMIDQNLNLILMPCYIKNVLNRDDVITPLHVHIQNNKKQGSHQETAPQVNQKQLQFIKQQQVLNILTFINEEIMKSDKKSKDLQLQIENVIKKVKTGLQKHDEMVKKQISSQESVLTDYHIEFVAIEFLLKPEKIFEGLGLNLFKDKHFPCQDIEYYEEIKS